MSLCRGHRNLQQMGSEKDSKPVLLLDLDDTLALTNVAVCKWHNEVYKTDLDIEDFHSFFYWSESRMVRARQRRVPLLTLMTRGMGRYRGRDSEESQLVQ